MAKKRVAQAVTLAVSTIVHCAVIVMICYFFAFSYQLAYQVFSNPVCDEHATSYHTVVIHEGEDSRSVVQELEEKGVIEDWTIAYLRLQVSSYKGKLKPGTYQVTASMSLDSIFAVLSQDAKEE